MATPWGTIREVNAAAVPKARQRSGMWIALYCEVKLRLEQTPADKALEIPFETELLCRRAYYAVYKYSHREDGAGFLQIYRRKADNNHHYLFVSRGPNWTK